MKWGLRAQRITMRPRDAISIENLGDRLLIPQSWIKSDETELVPISETAHLCE
jgi:hypothetical protein